MPVIRLRSSVSLNLPKVSEPDQLKILHIMHTKDRVVSYAKALCQGELVIFIRSACYIELIKKVKNVSGTR